MPSNHPYDKKENEDESGNGGQSGQVEFKDFLAGTSHLRDDLLPDEEKRLRGVHAGVNEVSIRKQKEKREKYQALKDEKVTLSAHRQQLMESGMNAAYQSHPLLSNKAQFSGIDRQVNALPNEQVAETNEDNRNELQNEYRLRFLPQQAPRFNPRPIR